jgi:hypothetical protein
VLYSWYQGATVHSRSTRLVSEAVVIYLLTSSAILWAGVVWGQLPGLYVAVVAFVTAIATQTGWLWHRSRRTMQAVAARDDGTPTICAADVSPR